MRQFWRSRWLAVCLTVAIGGGMVRAGAVLSSATTVLDVYGTVYDAGSGSSLAYYSDNPAQGIGWQSPNSASLGRADAATAPGVGSISANGSSTIAVLPSREAFTAISGTTAAAATAAVSTANTWSDTHFFGQAYGSFVLDADYNFTLTVTLAPHTSVTATAAAGGFASARAVGSYSLRGDSGSVAYGYSGSYTQGDYAGPVDYGFGSLNDLPHASGYAGTVTVTGVLHAGNYNYLFESDAFAYAEGAGSSASASDPLYFDLELAPLNPVPEPATCAMLGSGVLTLAGYGWRRKKAAA
jgi:hypothetical protein